MPDNSVPANETGASGSARLSALERRVDTIATDLAATRRDVTILRRDVTALTVRVDNLETKVDNLIVRVGALETKVDNLSIQVEANRMAINELGMQSAERDAALRREMRANAAASQASFNSITKLLTQVLAGPGPYGTGDGGSSDA